MMMLLRSRACALLRVWVAACWLVPGLALPGAAWADPARIVELLRIDPVFAILQREGVSYGEDLHRELLAGKTERGWTQEVAVIHAPARLVPEFRQIVMRELAGKDQAGIEAWLSSPLAQKVIGLEAHTRAMLLDKGRETAAIIAAQEADLVSDPRLAAVRRVIEATDLVETNVVSGMNANLAFLRAMAAGGAFPYQMTDNEMFGDVADQEEDIRYDATAWLEGFLYAAYAGLEPGEIDQIAGFNASAAGKQLQHAQMTAFGEIYEQTSAELGTALARRLNSSDL